MKRLNKILLTATLIFTASSAMAKVELVATDNYVTTDLCMVAGQGSKLQMHLTVKGSWLKKGFIVSEVKCNGEDVREFSKRYNLNSKKIIKYLNK